MPSSACKKCARSEEHTSELQSHDNIVCRLLLEKKTIRSYRKGSRFTLTKGSVSLPKNTGRWSGAPRLTPAQGPRSIDFFFSADGPPPSQPLFPPPPLSR